ncbi:hypothetical protein [Halorubellus salinus]|uniref:hypothetical protein n=1 Tax=Halorubellus salinus TaxID=755309 RepID=UPI001D08C6C1|nr:hypothetical protein [Halorubellus salinus]
MRPVRRSGTRSVRESLAAAATAAAGVVVLAVTVLGGACTQVGCARDTGVAFDGVSLSAWAIRWQESCNSCGASLTPVLAGVVLLVVGGCWLGWTATRAGDRGRFDDHE